MRYRGDKGGSLKREKKQYKGVKIIRVSSLLTNVKIFIYFNIARGQRLGRRFRESAVAALKSFGCCFFGSVDF